MTHANLKRQDYYVSAKKFLGTQIAELTDIAGHRKFYKYLAYNFYKATNSTGATVYYQVDSSGSSRLTNVEGIQQAFKMQFGFRLKIPKGQREPKEFQAIPFVLGKRSHLRYQRLSCVSRTRCTSIPMLYHW